MTAAASTLSAKAKRLPGVPFTLEHFRAWAAAHELDNDEPWLLEEFEERFAEDVFARIPICWLVVPEGNGKTTFVAGLALYIVEFKPSAYVPVAASARDQAEWIYRQAEGLVFRSGRKSEFKCLEGYRRIRHDGMGSRIQVFAADDRSGDGIIPGGIAVLDELHRHRDLSLYETWKGKLRKRSAQLVVISTAGEVGGEFELERERLRRAAGDVTRDGCFVRAVASLGDKPLSVLHDYAVPEDADIDDLEVVKAANPASYVTMESLLEKREMVRNDQHWSRFTCNRSTRGSLAAITEAEWFATKTAERIPAGEQVWVGLDLGWKIDTTAITPLWVRDAEFRLFGPAVVLVPPRNGDMLDARLIEDALLELNERTPIHTVVMDPHRGEQMAQWIEGTLKCRVVERQQSLTLQALDYSRFMDGLREKWIRHAGDEAFTRHALNAVARVLPRGDIVFERPVESRRNSREHDRRVVDALDAAAMVHSAAVDELAQPKKPEPSWAFA